MKNLQLCKCSHKKLSAKQVGPFSIIKVLGPVTYRLQLPKDWKIHNVFHVSLQKPYVSSPDHVLDDGQVVIPTQGVLELQLDRILGTRERSLRNRTQIEHLVQWKDYPEEDATWEDQYNLVRDYPKFMLR